MATEKFVVLNPEGAARRIEQKMHDAADGSSALCVTVHQVGNDAVGNAWECANGVWKRIIGERVEKSTTADQLMLIGETLRLVQDDRIANLAPTDLRLNLAVQGLVLQATSLEAMS